MKASTLILCASLLIALSAGASAQSFAVRLRLAEADTATLEFRAFGLRLCDPCRMPRDIANIQDFVDSLSVKGKLRLKPVVFRKIADTTSPDLERLRNSQDRIPSMAMDFQVDVNRDNREEETLLEFTDVRLIDLAKTYIVTKPASKTVVYEEYTFLYRSVSLGGKPARDHEFMKSRFVAPFVIKAMGR